MLEDTKKITAQALILYEAMEALSVFDKQEVVVILGGLVELDVRRYMRQSAERRSRAMTDLDALIAQLERDAKLLGALGIAGIIIYQERVEEILAVLRASVVPGASP